MARNLRVGHAQITLAAAPDAEGKVQQRIRTGAVGIGEQQARLRIVCGHKAERRTGRHGHYRGTREVAAVYING